MRYVRRPHPGDVPPGAARVISDKVKTGRGFAQKKIRKAATAAGKFAAGKAAGMIRRRMSRNPRR